MNPAAAKITERHSVNQSVTVVTKNWPSPFKRVVAKPEKANKPVLFVSTNLYSGHKPNGVPPMNDSELCDLEMDLLPVYLASLIWTLIINHTQLFDILIRILF